MNENAMVKRSKGTYTPRPLAAHKVDEWLVSKRYFLDAAKAFFGAQNLHRVTEWHLLTHPSQSLLIHSGLFLAFGKSAILKEECLKEPLSFRLAECQSLELLTVVVGKGAFKTNGGKELWQKELSDTKLMNKLNGSGLLDLRGLKDFEFVIPDRQAAAHETFTSNISRLEILVKAVVLDSRIAGNATSNSKSLYHRSAVRCDDGPQLYVTKVDRKRLNLPYFPMLSKGLWAQRAKRKTDGGSTDVANDGDNDDISQQDSVAQEERTGEDDSSDDHEPFHSNSQFEQQDALFDDKIITVKLPGLLKRQPRPLFDLPQKALDQIFTLAYGRQQNGKLWFKSGWKNNERRKEKEEKHRVRELYGKRHWRKAWNPTTPLPFPPHKVNEWMVSKRYFRAAAKAWMTAQDFDHMACDHLKENVSQHLLVQSGLFLEFGRAVALKSHNSIGWMVRRMVVCKSLKSVVITVNVESFKAIADNLPWVKRLDDDELLKVLEVDGVLKLRGLESFELQAVRSPVWRLQSKPAVFEENVARMNVLAQPFVSRPSLYSKSVPIADRLYTDSLVHYGTGSESQVCEQSTFGDGKALTDVHDMTEIEALRFEDVSSDISNSV